MIAVATGAGSSTRHWTVLPQIVAYMALGGSMFLALLLQGFGIRIFPLAGCAAALAIEVVFRDYGVFGQVVCARRCSSRSGLSAWPGETARHAC